MKIKKHTGLILTLTFLFLTSAQAQGTKNFKWQDGEVLVYEVTWSFLNLGIITVYNLGKTELNGIEVNHIRINIESNPLLFWLDHESVYNSFLTNELRVLRFVSDENIDGISYNGQYDFNYDRKKIEITLFDKENKNNVLRKEMPLKKKMVDGISLIHYARVNSLETKQDTATTFIENKAGDVTFNFSLTKGITKIKSIPDGINTVYLDGEIKMKGIAGITGPFKTWYSDDYSRVPILAFMEVFIGEVKVELKSWKLWSPKKLITENLD
jgi:hypothetical protein